MQQDFNSFLKKKQHIQYFILQLTCNVNGLIEMDIIIEIILNSE